MNACCEAGGGLACQCLAPIGRNQMEQRVMNVSGCAAVVRMCLVCSLQLQRTIASALFNILVNFSVCVAPRVPV